MRVIDAPAALRKIISSWKGKGEKVGFVPTMGYLHEGHLSLVREAHRHTQRIVLSIFVNPRQFGPNEDLEKYPRDLDRDKHLAESEGVDILFFPPVDVMYPEGYQTNVSVPDLASGMCGESRPGHFDGVATVVTKLFNLVQPDAAVFGEKDYQQLALIRQLTRDLNFSIDILGHPIVRENDGLAMSSRNRYLNPKERKEALCLSRALKFGKTTIAEKGDCPSIELIADIRKIIENEESCVVDYVTIVDSVNLRPVITAKKGDVIAVAVQISQKVRLIDNIKL